MRQFFFICLTILLASCEGTLVMTGRVLTTTNEPVIGAKVELLKVPVDSFAITRDSGIFFIGTKMMGLIPKPKYIIRISKKDFQTLEVPINKQTISQYKFPEGFRFQLKPMN